MCCFTLHSFKGARSQRARPYYNYTSDSSTQLDRHGRTPGSRTQPKLLTVCESAINSAHQPPSHLVPSSPPTHFLIPASTDNAGTRLNKTHSCNTRTLTHHRPAHHRINPLTTSTCCHTPHIHSHTLPPAHPPSHYHAKKSTTLLPLMLRIAHLRGSLSRNMPAQPTRKIVQYTP